MNTMRDDAYKIGCGRLVFARGAIESLGIETAKLGRKPLVVCGENAFRIVGLRIEQQLQQAHLPYQMETYNSACSEESAMHYAQVLSAQHCDVVIGAGGGRILDLVKIIADIADVPVVTLPTISATCAAYTPLSVVYTEEGRCRGTWYFHREVSLVLCDLDILCAQPPRYLAAGMIDAIAKHVEIKHHLDTLPADAQDVLLATQLAQTIYQDLFALAPLAMNDLHSDKAVRCIFHSIISAGMVSGIARGMYQAAMAHAFYEVIRSMFPYESKPWLHGEVVGVGLRLQEMYNGDMQELAALTQLMQQLQMPISLADIFVPNPESAIPLIAAHAPLPSFYKQADDESRVIQHLHTMQFTNS